MESETKWWSKFNDGMKATVEKMLGLEEINQSETAGLWELHLGIQAGRITIWVKFFEELWQSSPGLSF